MDKKIDTPHGSSHRECQSLGGDKAEEERLFPVNQLAKVSFAVFQMNKVDNALIIYRI